MYCGVYCPLRVCFNHTKIIMNVSEPIAAHHKFDPTALPPSLSLVNRRVNMTLFVAEFSFRENPVRSALTRAIMDTPRSKNLNKYKN